MRADGECVWRRSHALVDEVTVLMMDVPAASHADWDRRPADQLGTRRAGGWPASAVAAGGAAAIAARAGAGAASVSSVLGDVAEFLDVDVDEVAGVRVFVAADRLSGGAV
jgi:hypothetical protein